MSARDVGDLRSTGSASMHFISPPAREGTKHKRQDRHRFEVGWQQSVLEAKSSSDHEQHVVVRGALPRIGARIFSIAATAMQEADTSR
jgi:hypothetical protein